MQRLGVMHTFTYLCIQACMEFAEEMQQDISEAIYARVDTDSAAAIADDFCPKAVAPEVGDLATARVLRLHSVPSFSV